MWLPCRHSPAGCHTSGQNQPRVPYSWSTQPLRTSEPPSVPRLRIKVVSSQILRRIHESRNTTFLTNMGPRCHPEVCFYSTAIQCKLAYRYVYEQTSVRGLAWGFTSEPSRRSSTDRPPMVVPAIDSSILNLTTPHRVLRRCSSSRCLQWRKTAPNPPK
jgi:hypothetical protein